MKSIALITLALMSFNINAGEILNKLKQTPASQYQVGIFQLEFGAYILTEQLKDTKIKGTSFKLKKISVEQTETSVFLKFSATGKTKDVTENECKLIKDAHSKSFVIGNYAKELWPGLTDNDYKKLSKELLMKYELISKDNANFRVSC